MAIIAREVGPKKRAGRGWETKMQQLVALQYTCSHTLACHIIYSTYVHYTV